MLPSLVDDENLPTANTLAGQSRNLSRLVGSAIGGVLVATGGLAPLVVVDAGSFVVSAALLARRPPAPCSSRTAATSLRHRLTDLRREWTEGLRVTSRHRVLRTVLLFLLITCIGEGIMGTLFAPFVGSILHGSGPQYGMMLSAQAVGWDRRRPARRLARQPGRHGAHARLRGDGVRRPGPGAVPVPVAPAVWPRTVLVAAAGIPGAFVIVAALTLIQRHATDTHRGRVFGALNVVEAAAVVAGTLTAGFLAHALGLVAVLATQGAGYVVAGRFVLAVLRAPPPPSPTSPVPFGPKTDHAVAFALRPDPTRPPSGGASGREYLGTKAHRNHRTRARSGERVAQARVTGERQRRDWPPRTESQ